METTKQCTQCKEIKPLSSFNVNFAARGELNTYCKSCFDERDQECRQCHQTTPFSLLSKHTHRGVVICQSCYDEIQKKNKSMKYKILMTLSVVLLLIPNFFKVNAVGFMLLWMLLLLAFGYISDPYREGDTKSEIERKNGQFAALLIPTLILILIMVFSPESCDFRFIY